jgi:hypothetical protein
MNKPMDKPKYRALRIIEYVGDRDWVDEQIAKRQVKGSFVLPNGRGVVREAMIGDTVELLTPVETNGESNANSR